jgi:hypothetical protein
MEAGDVEVTLGVDVLVDVGVAVGVRVNVAVGVAEAIAVGVGVFGVGVIEGGVTARKLNASTSLASNPQVLPSKYRMVE